MLTPRQQETINNLSKKNITAVMDIIKWCVESIQHPKSRSMARKANVPPRRHSKKYYQEIINHFAQQKESVIPPSR